MAAQTGPAETYRILYEFFEPGGADEPLVSYGIELDGKTLALKARPASGEPPPDWTRLGHEQCEGCPLKSAEHPHCPIAVNLSALIRRFSGEASHRKVRVRVTTPERAYLKDTSMQDGLFSIFGVIMAT